MHKRKVEFKKCILFMIGAVLLLTGCGNKDGQGENALDGLTTNEQIDSTEVEKLGLEERVLTIQELKDFTYFINEDDNHGNYGFLLSEYDKPEQVDLHQVLYTGGGLQTEGLTEQERLAFEKIEEIETDIIKLTTKQIDDYLQRKMGISFADVTSKFLWTYLPEYDCYVSQRGDTNITNFICTRGLQIGDDLFELHFDSVDNYDDCILTLRKVDGIYQFVSNEFTTNTDDTKNIWKIDEQSFDVELDDWGNVQFVTYGPNVYDRMNSDVIFELQREGETIFEFPGVQRNAGNGTDNIRINDRFEAVLAVTFQDYNKDGYKDVVIINQYKNSSTEATTYQYEARIYKGLEEDFHYVESLSDAVNRSEKNDSIAKVMNQIEQQELDLSMLDENIRQQIEIFAFNREQWILKDYGPFICEYGVIDLDGDGRLELVATAIAGSGFYSENHFYQVDDKGTGIIELRQEFYSENAELDLRIEGVYQDEELGRTYYLADDITKAGAAEAFTVNGYFYLENGCVYSKAIRGYYIISKDENSSEESYYDSANNEISLAEWEDLYDQFLVGKISVENKINKSSMYSEDAEKATEKEILRMLLESYGEDI